MAEKKELIYLTEGHQDFAFFTNRDQLACAFTFEWDEKKTKYKIGDLYMVKASELFYWDQSSLIME